MMPNLMHETVPNMLRSNADYNKRWNKQNSYVPWPRVNNINERKSKGLRREIQVSATVFVFLYI